MILGGYKQIVEYLRTVAKVIEGICNKNDLLGEQSSEMVDGLIDATRELLGKALTTEQKEPVIEPAWAPSAEKTSYTAIAAKELDHPRGSSHRRATKKRKPPQRSRVSRYWGKCPKGAL